MLLDYGVFVNGSYGCKKLLLFVVMEKENYNVVYIFLKYGVDFLVVGCYRGIGLYYREVIINFGVNECIVYNIYCVEVLEKYLGSIVYFCLNIYYMICKKYFFFWVLYLFI